MRTLQGATAEKLTLLGFMVGEKDIEKELHSKFASCRIRGEWFMPSATLLDFISSKGHAEVKYVEEEINELEKTIGNSIKTLRLLKNIDRKTLCKMSGLSMNALRHLEGGNGATVKALVCVVKALNKESWLSNLAPEISINPLYMTDKGTPRRRASKRRGPSQ